MIGTKIIWTPEMDQVLIDGYGVIPYAEMGKVLGVSIASLKKRTGQLGIRVKIGTNPISALNTDQTKYSVNHNFFSVPSVLNCYWAGFLAADGCILSDTRVKLGIQTRDVEHLERFKFDTGFSGPIIAYEGQSIVQMSSAQWVKDLLLNFNLTPRKSLTLKHPNLSELDLIDAFLIGVIDGDGSIMLSRDKRGLESPRIQIASGSIEFCRWLNTNFSRLSNTDGNRIYKASSPNGLTVTITHAAAARTILNLRYVNVPRLARKWDKVSGVQLPRFGYTVMGVKKMTGKWDHKKKSSEESS